MRTGTFLILLAVAASLKADYINVTLNSNAYGGGCGSRNGSPGEPCYGAPDVSSVLAEAAVNTPGGPIQLGASAAYGMNKVYAYSSGSASANAGSEWMVTYSLSGAPVGTPITLVANLGYNVTVASSGSSEAGFRMVINNDVFSPLDIYTTTNGFGGDRCFDRPGAVAPGACAGTHSGIVSRAFTASAGPNNRFTLFVGASAFGSASSDAFHTAWIDSIVVPDGVTWSYAYQPGDPLQFRYAAVAPPAGVPEPAHEIPMAAAGLVALAAWMGKRRG